MPPGAGTELHARLLLLCHEFGAAGDIGCEVALDERHTSFDAEVSDAALDRWPSF